MSLQEVEWVPVKRKKRNNRHQHQPLSWTAKFEREQSTLINEDGEWVQAVIQMVDNASKALHWQSTTATTRLLCLGLGSPEDSRSARLQLAFVLELSRHIQLPLEKAEFYDPIFASEDIEGLSVLGVKAYTGEEATEAQHTIRQETIIFMPHCDINLYQSLLAANMPPEEGLRRMLIIGNPIDQYLTTTEKRRLDEEFPLVQRLATHPGWKSMTIPPARCDEKAFVSLSIQHLVPPINQESTHFIPHADVSKQEIQEVSPP